MKRLNHLNLVVENIDAVVARYVDLYGAELLLDVPKPEVRAALVAFGDVIFDLFQPHEFLLCARYGPHYLGVEYQADMAEVREVLAARGIRILRDIGGALHTHPADGFGVSFEFYDGTFHDLSWPLLDGAQMKPATYWRDEHPLGITGLKGYTIAVEDIDAARAFMHDFLGAKSIYEAPRQAIGGRVAGLEIGDCVVELIGAEGDGVLRKHLHRFGQGIRSTVFGVRDLDQARRYFVEHGIEMIAGDAQESLATPADVNHGGIFEFRRDGPRGP